jgi:REP element-mobilizing transposase RayT
MQTNIPLEPGHYYHIYNRGNNRENIFFEERNYLYFMQLYQKYILPACDTFAYCLMRNHFHLLMRVKENPAQASEVFETSEVSKQASHDQTSEALKTSEVSSKVVVQRFSNFFNSYAKAINTTYHRTGSLFQNRFSRIEVDPDRYFARLVHYIHFNPQKHGFAADFRQYPYSSYQTLVSAKPTNLRRAEALAWFQGQDNFIKFHEILGDETAIRHLVPEDFD